MQVRRHSSRTALKGDEKLWRISEQHRPRLSSVKTDVVTWDLGIQRDEGEEIDGANTAQERRVDKRRTACRHFSPLVTTTSNPVEKFNERSAQEIDIVDVHDVDLAVVYARDFVTSRDYKRKSVHKTRWCVYKFSCLQLCDFRDNFVAQSWTAKD